MTIRRHNTKSHSIAADGTGVHGAEDQHNVGHVQIRLHSRKISKVLQLRLDAGPHVRFLHGAAKVQAASRPGPFLQRFEGRRRRGLGQRRRQLVFCVIGHRQPIQRLTPGIVWRELVGDRKVVERKRAPPLSEVRSSSCVVDHASLMKLWFVEVLGTVITGTASDVIRKACTCFYTSFLTSVRREREVFRQLCAVSGVLVNSSKYCLGDRVLCTRGDGTILPRCSFARHVRTKSAFLADDEQHNEVKRAVMHVGQRKLCGTNCWKRSLVMRDQEIRSAVESCSCELKHIVSVLCGSELAVYEGRFLFLWMVADFS